MKDGSNSNISEIFYRIGDGVKDSNVLGCYSNYFQSLTRKEIWRGSKGISASHENLRITQDVDSRFNYDINTFKAWLSERYNSRNPLIVNYVTANPTEENIELPELPSFEDYTKIEVLTEVPPSKIEVEYDGYTITE